MTLDPTESASWLALICIALSRFRRPTPSPEAVALARALQGPNHV